MIRKMITAIALTAIALYSCNSGTNSPGDNTAPQATPAVSEGKALFASNCAICHDPKKDKTGPALQGALARWNNDTARMKAFIHNSQKVISDGDLYATELFHKWANTAMTPFPSLTDHELNAIIEYINKGEE
ncbi:c-type cytochrome [Chitinophagaceae bacterium MMS25-I14]